MSRFRNTARLDEIVLRFNRLTTDIYNACFDFFGPKFISFVFLLFKRKFTFIIKWELEIP